jgi:histidinol dehydrogenase
MIKILKYSEIDKNDLFLRDIAVTRVGGAVADIIDNVRSGGDRALLDYALKFDKAELSAVEVSEAELDFALSQVSSKLLGILERAAENIRAFHKNQVRPGFITNSAGGVISGQRVLPIEKVGLYVPGGTAAYPSSVLMNCIPAVIAGCELIVMTTPPSADGTVNPAILAAAKIAGVHRVFKAGGAQAIAALAYGTETVPAVDKIVGPGNAYVAEAKRQVFGKVAIDMIAGPSEILVVADKTCNPAYVAADLLSQAEHDRMASAVLVTDSTELASAVSKQLEKQIPLLSRSDIARTSIDNNGKIIVADNLFVAVDIANELAPEHLEICTDSPFDYLSRIKNAGSVFLGKHCPEAVGDYFAGPNHTLPTSGTARFSSPLSVDDFVKKTQYTYYTREALESIAGDVDAFAKAEGLTAHAKSVSIRFEGSEKINE